MDCNKTSGWLFRLVCHSLSKSKCRPANVSKTRSGRGSSDVKLGDILLQRWTTSSKCKKDGSTSYSDWHIAKGGPSWY